MKIKKNYLVSPEMVKCSAFNGQIIEAFFINFLAFNLLEISCLEGCSNEDWAEVKEKNAFSYKFVFHGVHPFKN